MNFIMKPKPPFNFELTAGFFSYDDFEIRIFENGIFQQVIRINEKLALCQISSTGTITEPELAVTLRASQRFDAKDRKCAKKIISSIFNLEFDLNDFYSMVCSDVIVGQLIERLNGLKGPNNTTVFEGLVCSILEQQISLNVAFNLQKRVTKRFGETLELDGARYYAFPTPQILANADLPELRECGLSQRKSEYIKDISLLIIENRLDIEKYRGNCALYKDPQSIIDELTKLRGIGAWTVELTMLRAMQRFDVVPADDLGLKRFVAKHYFKGKKIATADVRAAMDRFGTWKGLVAYYFLEADRLGLSFE